MRFRLLVLLSFLFALTNCVSFGEQWQHIVDGGPQNTAKPAAPQPVTYSEQNNLEPNVLRQYHRTTAADLVNQAHLGAGAGSLWVMQGQGAYLFAQNTVRMIGDPIPVLLNGDPAAQLSAKAHVIATLLSELAARRRLMAGMRAPAAEQAKQNNANPNNAGSNAQNAANSTEKQNAAAKYAFKVKMVPARVVDRLINGNYRVRGMQSFMIDRREYKVIVSGIVRSEDFNDQGINASQLLDSKFDIVSAKGVDLRE